MSERADDLLGPVPEPPSPLLISVHGASRRAPRPDRRQVSATRLPVATEREEPLLVALSATPDIVDVSFGQPVRTQLCPCGSAQVDASLPDGRARHDARISRGPHDTIGHIDFYLEATRADARANRRHASRSRVAQRRKRGADHASLDAPPSGVNGRRSPRDQVADEDRDAVGDTNSSDVPFTHDHGIGFVKRVRCASFSRDEHPRSMDLVHEVEIGRHKSDFGGEPAQILGDVFRALALRDAKVERLKRGLADAPTSGRKPVDKTGAREE